MLTIKRLGVTYEVRFIFDGRAVVRWLSQSAFTQYGTVGALKNYMKAKVV